MSPAAPTRPDATILATDEATAPPLDDPTAAADAADAATPRRADTPADAARTAQIAATFDELAPVHDRMATILSLGMDRRWRAAVVAETRLTPGDSQRTSRRRTPLAEPPRPTCADHGRAPPTNVDERCTWDGIPTRRS